MRAIITALFLILVSQSAGADVVRFGFSNSKCAFVIEGEISETSLSTFRKNLFQKRDQNTCLPVENGEISKGFIKDVVLKDSIGGDIQSAFEIMKIIQEEKLNTFVDTAFSGFNKCQSACALIFASGKQRHLSNNFQRFEKQNSYIGVHKPYFIEGSYQYLEEEKKLDEMKYEIIEFLKKNQIDPRFTIKMFETSSSDMFFPKLTDLLIWRVVTSVETPQSLKFIGLDRNLKIEGINKKYCKPKQSKEYYMLAEVKKDLTKMIEAMHRYKYNTAALEKIMGAFPNLLGCNGVIFLND